MSKHEERLQQFADELVKQIENNQAPWQKGWKSGLMDILPVNHKGTPYRGNNMIELMMVASIKGYNDNRWYTYNNAQEHGGHVRKGEKGTVITFFSRTQTRNKKDEQGNPILDSEGNPEKETVILDRPVIKTAVVFNAEQIDGLPERELHTPMTEWERHSKAEAIIKGIESQGVTIEHKLGDKAYYSPIIDKIVMPERGQFESADVYYATILHEIGHSTGHESRLNRDLSGEFGSESYAKEELRAEIASMMIGQELQIGYDPSQHHAYLKSWAKVIKEDPTEILRAVKDADKIAEYVLDLGRNIEIEEKKNEYSELRPQDIAYLERIQANFDGAKAERIANSFDGVRDIAQQFVSQEITNIHSGMTAIISKNNLDKMLSNKAHEKSANLHLHLIAVANADKIFKNSILVWKHNDKDELSGNIIHRAIAPLKIDDEVYLTKLTIKELAREQGNRIYSIEAVEIENEKSPVPEMMRDDLDKQELSQHRHNRALVDIVVKNAQDFNRSQEKKTEKSVNEHQEQRIPQQNLPKQERIYLYTSFKDVQAMQDLKNQGIVRFDATHQVWYTHERHKNAVAQWTTRPSVPTPEQDFVNFLQSRGINVTAGHPIFDEKTHRLSNEGSQAKNVMYQAYSNPNGIPFARVTNFSRGGEPENWQYPKEYLHILKNIEAVERAKGNQSYSHSQTVTIKPQQPQAPVKAQKELEQEKIAQQNLMAERAKMVMSFAPIAPNEQNYLARKQVTANDLVRIVPDSSKLPDNLKEHILIGDTPKQFAYLREQNPDKLVLQRGNLMIPQFNAQNELRAFETISYNGGKYALQGAEKQGLSTTLGELENGKPILLVEGYATGATLHEQTKRNVVVAFGRNGLMDMAQILREQYPDSKIYIGADNDHQKVLENKPNIGLEDANKVAQTVSNTYVLVPQFNSGDTGKDWNDILVDKGVDTLKYQLQTQLNSINPPKKPVEKTDKKVELDIKNSQTQEKSKDPLDIKNIKENYPNMSENNIKAIQEWREYLPIKFANEPIKHELAVNRLVDKLPDLANGETLNPPPKPEQIQERKPPDTGR